jgi:murein DD-endopeptidase MepM/ murein hydrolase activator NlpD
LRDFRQIVRTLHNRRWRAIPLTVLVGAFALVGIVAIASVAVMTRSASTTTTLSATSAKERIAAESDDAKQTPAEGTTKQDPPAPKETTAQRADADPEKADRPSSEGVEQKTGRDEESATTTKAEARKAEATKAAQPEKEAEPNKETEQSKEAGPEDETAEQEEAREAAEERAARERSNPEWVLPIESYVLTGRFGQSGNRWASYHHGLDFAADSGTPIRAVGRGEIIAAGWEGAYGNRILVRHPDGTVTLYAHMSGFERTSGTVEPGTVIGYVGATGNVTGPHLHLEVRPNGGGLNSAIDPFAWLADKGLDP